VDALPALLETLSWQVRKMIIIIDMEVSKEKKWADY
jgi:hypothetical protein